MGLLSWIYAEFADLTRFQPSRDRAGRINIDLLYLNLCFYHLNCWLVKWTVCNFCFCNQDWTIPAHWCVLPGKHLTLITKKCKGVGVITEQLHHLGIDCSFYPLVLKVKIRCLLFIRHFMKPMVKYPMASEWRVSHFL